MTSYTTITNPLDGVQLGSTLPGTGMAPGGYTGNGQWVNPTVFTSSTPAVDPYQLSRVISELCSVIARLEAKVVSIEQLVDYISDHPERTVSEARLVLAAQDKIQEAVGDHAHT